MPFSVGDVMKHTKKATTSALKKQWVEIANSELKDCDEGDDDCEAAAITKANGVIARAVSESDTGEEDSMTTKAIKGQAIDLGNGLMLVRVEPEPEMEEAEPGQWQAVELTYTQVTEPEEEEDPAPEETTEEVAELAEAEIGQALSISDITETDVTALGISGVNLGNGRRAPVLVDFQIIQPGPGNKKDNHYYPRPVLERDAGVFDGVDVFVTDHNEAERSERTKVGRVRRAPTRFTENGSPVGQVVIYDPDVAEKARNRADAGELSTLECSIYARGSVKPGKVDGAEYKVVEAITEGLYLELVSKAGAGGKALSLAESEQGGNHMPEEQETTQEAATEEELHENEAPTLLAEADVKRLLSETHLPRASRDKLAEGEWADDEALRAAIVKEVEYVKAVSGSGQPTDLGGDQTTAVEETAQQRERRKAILFNDIMAEVGITSRTPVPELQEA